MFPTLITALLLGVRHGYDIDHVAAISDLSATGGGGLRAFRLSTVYALGHAAVLLAFGVAAVSFGLVIPEAVDGLMARVIGITLIALALYVVVGFVRFGRTWEPRSRGSLIWRAAHRRLHRHDIDHDASTAGAFVIGMIHGVGAETPTQLLLVPAAAEFGLGVVVAFVGGLLLTNTVLGAISAWGLIHIRGSLAYGALSISAAAFFGRGGLGIRSRLVAHAELVAWICCRSAASLRRSMLTDANVLATLPVSDPGRAKRFYREMLGLRPLNEVPEKPPVRMRRRRSLLALSDQHAAPSEHTQMSLLSPTSRRKLKI